MTEPRPIASMPGVVQHTRDSLRKAAAEAVAGRASAGSCSSACPRRRDATGSGGIDPDGILNVAIRDVRRRGRRRDRGDGRPLPGRVHRPRPLRRARPPTAASTTTPPCAATPRWPWRRPTPGPTWSAPSGMMDGQVGVDPRRRSTPPATSDVGDPRLRRQVRLGVLRPVPRGRRVARCTATARTYQQDPANVREALREVALDVGRGRRHRDGQARAALPRRAARPSPSRRGRPGRGLPGLRRVRDGRGRRRRTAGSTATGRSWRR